ncbi:MAG: TIGR02206 family membrane protein [Paenibacillus sp.]|nr:TIGR02206 family membrane protein [Paenibacillus sp.]
MDLSTLFDRQRTTDFIMFSTSHWIGLTVLALISLLLYFSRFTIRQKHRLRNGLRLILVITLISCEVGLQLWYVSQDVWKPTHSLPMELCGITLMLSVIMLITRNRLLYSFLYFAGIGGAFIALITPNLVYPFPHIRFLLFFVVHGAIILASLYMTWIEGLRPTWKSLFFTMICLNVVAAAVWVANTILGANYMFLSHKPDTYSFLNYFGQYPYYLLIEELFAFAVFLMMYLFFFWLPDRFRTRYTKGGHFRL